MMLRFWDNDDTNDDDIDGRLQDDDDNIDG